MNKPKTIIKVGGNELDNADFIEDLAAAVSEYQKTKACILVHGGGRVINQLMEQMQIEPKYKNGQRVTDAATLEITEMVLSGKLNKRLVLALLNAGMEVVGLSGVDRKLLQVEPWGEEMDLVGRIVKVRHQLLEEYCSNGVVPVVSPISIGPAGRYNVNADHAAGMIAGALQAERVVFISNIPGVLVGDRVASVLSKQEVEALVEEETINGGMIPKVTAALNALKSGAQSAVITNLTGFKQNSGTIIVTERK